ncbi:hypothetical protein ACHAPT_001236 [Fusarium lateritium]
MGGDFGMNVNIRRKDFDFTGPWDLFWDLPVRKGASAEATMDDFDHTIDFGDRRDRARKAFEWELDRLYLAEETEKRRLKRQEEADLLAQRERDAAMEKTAHNLNDKSNCPNNGNKDGDEDDETEDVNFAEPQANQADWPTFKQLAKAERKHTCIIDILTEEPIIDNDLANLQGLFGYTGVHIRKVERPQAINTTSMATGQAPLPERIRITSVVLREILVKILEAQGSLADIHKHGSWVFIRPFKALMYFEQALRDWCKALEEKFGLKAATNAPASVEADTTSAQDGSQTPTDEGDGGSTKLLAAEPSAIEREVVPKRHDETKDGDRKGQEDKAPDEDDDDDGTKSRNALTHLSCLLGFLDSHITDKRTYLNGSGCHKVFFSDLWHLYRPRLEVIGSDGKQAYRVIHVTSPAHRVVPAWQRYNTTSKDKSSNAAFSITCVYIDFDGTHIGPVLRTFNFKSFEGEREVVSFEVYPLRFHPPLKRSDFSEAEWKDLESMPASDRLRRRLIRRGAKFLEVAAVKHM